MPSGSYLEYYGSGDATLYGASGEFLRSVAPQGTTPTLVKGPNAVSYSSDSSVPRSRSKVTVILWATRCDKFATAVCSAGTNQVNHPPSVLGRRPRSFSEYEPVHKGKDPGQIVLGLNDLGIAAERVWELDCDGATERRHHE